MDQNQFKVLSALLFKYFKYIWLLKFKSFQGFSRWCWTLTKTVSSHKLELKSFHPSWCSCIVFLFVVHSTLQLLQTYYNMLFSLIFIIKECNFDSRWFLHEGLLTSQNVAIQRAKKVVSDSLGLVDFAIRLVNSVLNLPNGQVDFFEEFKLLWNQSADQNVFLTSWNDIWASKC